jgi:hypothetical protein
MPRTCRHYHGWRVCRDAGQNDNFVWYKGTFRLFLKIRKFLFFSRGEYQPHFQFRAHLAYFVMHNEGEIELLPRLKSIKNFFQKIF